MGAGVLLWALGAVALIAIVVLVVVLVVRALAEQGRPPQPPQAAPPAPEARPGVSPGARAILEERFARGEIDAEEFSARLRVLERG